MAENTAAPLAPAELESVIRQILKMDENARKITKQALLDRKTAEDGLSEKKQALHDEYLERAGRRVQLIAQQEQALLSERLDEIERRQQAQLQRLAECAEQKAAQWATDVFEKIVEVS